MSKKQSWNTNIIRIWPNYFPPCRPSISEIAIYTKYLREMQVHVHNRKIRLLILGSTIEFRDWAYEEYLDVTVVDYNAEYYKSIDEQRKYKYAKEHFINTKWQEMILDGEFDLILGDLVIGNLQNPEIPIVLEKISGLLSPGGYFMTKSFFRDEGYPIKKLKDIFGDYRKSGSVHNPFSELDFDVSLACMDLETGFLDFRKAYEDIKSLYDTGVIDVELFESFSHLGWQDEMKFRFNIPTISMWEMMALRNFNILSKEYGNDVYSANFPVYIMVAK